MKTRARATERLAYLEAFTQTHRRLMDGPPALREAACLRLQLPWQFAPLRPGDVFAGRLNALPLLFSPEDSGVGYVFHADRLVSWIDRDALTRAERSRLERVATYWARYRTDAVVRRAYPAALSAGLPSDAWTDEPGIAFPLYRMAGATLDYGKLLRRGLPGLAEDCRSVSDEVLRAALGQAVGLLNGLCRRYAQEAERLGEHELNTTLGAITDRPPETLREAIQLVWLFALVSGASNFGRADAYLGPFLTADLASGRLDQHAAQELVTAWWRVIAERNTVFNGRVVIGGTGRPDPTAADAFARLALEATRQAPGPEPQLSLRLSDDQDPGLFDTALDLLGEGLTYPILYDDATNVPAVMHAFGVPRELAERYVPFGCGEYVLEGHSFGTPSGVINLLEALRQVVLAAPPGGFATFDGLINAYEACVERHIAWLAEQQKLEYDVVAAEASCLYFTLLYDHCLERSRAIFDGGVAHLGGTLETYGNTNTADSLTALCACVYDQASLTFEQVRSALHDDFTGHDAARALLNTARKYGNDDDTADAMAARVHEHACRATAAQAERVGLDSYLVVVINNHANTILGRHTGASPDGRHAGEPLACGNNPSGGADRHGLTAMLRSLTRLDPSIHAGTVQNLKLSPRLFSPAHRPKLRAMLEAYFDQGGTQLMVTTVNADDLRDAMDHPERYPNLLVRVGGFSARFVELDRDVQLEIISRTCHGAT